MKKGREVILYIIETIQADEIELEREAVCDEVAWCNIVTGNSTLATGLVYRSPNINEEDNITKISQNYRPVILTSVICKLLERLIKDHMVDFLVRHKLLNQSQHEFLKARLYVINMLRCLEEITKWIGEGSSV